MVEVDVVTVTAYQCTFCKGLFPDRDSAFEHLDTCKIRNAVAVADKNYVETDFGNMIMKEAI